MQNRKITITSISCKKTGSIIYWCISTEGDNTRENIHALFDPIFVLGKMTWSVNFYDTVPKKVLKPESLLSMRKKNTLRKLEKQVPLFAATEFDKRINSNDEYFDINAIEKRQKKRQEMFNELLDYKNAYPADKEICLIC